MLSQLMYPIGSDMKKPITFKSKLLIIDKIDERKGIKDMKVL